MQANATCCLEAGESRSRFGSLAGKLNEYRKDAWVAFKALGYFAADVAAIAKSDPALAGAGKAPLGGRYARLLELPLYASFWALALHRVAHFLFEARLPFLPRFLSQLARLLTGVEIHPGARIGPGLFIDHGSGVVIGETAILGRDIRLFHGVTLGGVDGRRGRRHPLIGDGVVIGCGAKVLGPITVGAGARIGAQSVLLADLPPGATAVGVPARIVERLDRAG